MTRIASLGKEGEGVAGEGPKVFDYGNNKKVGCLQGADHSSWLCIFAARERPTCLYMK